MKEAIPTNTGNAQKLPAGIPLAAPANASMLTLNSAPNNLQTDIMTDPADAPVQNRIPPYTSLTLLPKQRPCKLLNVRALKA
jgi:hypothetical protein